MSEAQPKSMGMPATEEGEGRKFMQAGLHLAKVISMVVANDKNDQPRTDKNGNPGLKVTFQNKEGEQIDGVYYYSPFGLDDPRRKEKPCDSEWRLHNLKKALGFGNKPVKLDEVLTKKIWLVVILQEYYDNAGNPVFTDKNKQKKFHNVGEAYPYDPNIPDKGRPVLKGDPRTDNENFLTGVFYERKVDTTVTVASSQAVQKDFAEDQLVSGKDVQGAVPGDEW